MELLAWGIDNDRFVVVVRKGQNESIWIFKIMKNDHGCMHSLIFELVHAVFAVSSARCPLLYGKFIRPMMKTGGWISRYFVSMHAFRYWKGDAKRVLHPLFCISFLFFGNFSSSGAWIFNDQRSYVQSTYQKLHAYLWNQSNTCSRGLKSQKCSFYFT